MIEIQEKNSISIVVASRQIKKFEALNIIEDG